RLNFGDKHKRSPQRHNRAQRSINDTTTQNNVPDPSTTFSNLFNYLPSPPTLHMASEAVVSDINSVSERNRDMSLFLPFLVGFSDATPPRDSDDPDRETGSSEGGPRQRIILVNPFTQGMVVIDGASSVEALFRELGGGKGGRPPASKESIDAMASVEIGEGCEGLECVVCLEEFGIGGVAKEMPCKHRFHPNCIEKWLGIHGSCPVCRYEMPVEERGGGKKREEEGGDRTRGGGDIWVSFSFNRRRGQDHDQASSADSNDDSSSSHRDDAV
ncbi:E3 ubiquitin-protein ligase SIRP1, partial [Mucuna pruriens]